MSYPIEIEIDEPHTEVIDELLTEMEHCVMDIRDRWEKTADRIVHTADLDDLLADRNAVAFVWDIHDVKEQRPDLSDEQSWGVLQECRQDQHCFDRLDEIMREAILDAADKLHPQRRQARSSKAAEVIAGYGDGDERENLVDLLTDSMHWCRSFGEPFEEFCGTARLHFDEETKPSTKGVLP